MSHQPTNYGKPLTIMMVAGEPSGDSHGAELIHALKEQRPGIRVIGVGGVKMAAAGQEQLFDMASHAVLGLTEVIKKYFKFRKFRARILECAKAERPDVVVFIDCSGFNLRLTPRIRRDLPGSRLIYYISPQVWASRASRVKAMQRDLDLLLSILPFEKKWFAQAAPNLDVQWVGHPALDRIHKPEGVQPRPNCIALLPGSRRTEVEAHLPLLWEAARIMGRVTPGLRFILLSPSEASQKMALDLIAELPAPNFAFEYNVGYAISHLSRCSLALVASGTASLECAIVGIPQIVVYKVHPLTYEVGRRLIKVKHLSLINVMAGEAVIPEFIQHEFEPTAVAHEALEILSRAQRRQDMKRRVAQIVATLGEPGASKRAAEAILLQSAFAK